jgi:signal recognition particle subunit SRP54
MFDGLTSRLSGLMQSLKGRVLRDADIDEAMQSIKIALLDADVALEVVKAIVESVSETARGKRKISGVLPSQLMLKMIKDRMMEIMCIGASEKQPEPMDVVSLESKKKSKHRIVKPLDIDVMRETSAKRSRLHVNKGGVILMVGLQGSGKTTSTVKIARYITKKYNFKVLVASIDVYRPAAIEQLKIFAESAAINSFVSSSQHPLTIATEALAYMNKEGYDCLIVDTAGRSQIDENMMSELCKVAALVKPIETLLVLDAMTGQDAVNIARGFASAVDVSGVVLSRIDGDSRGGAALSVSYVTSLPVKFFGIGEKADALEEFHADRLISRILGHGDVMSLVEKAIDSAEKEDLQKSEEKFRKGKFDLNDMQQQLKYVAKMGGINRVMSFIPGAPKITEDQKKQSVDILKKSDAILCSMKSSERVDPSIIGEKRKSQIAKGSGTSVEDINTLLQRHQAMVKMMKQVSSGINKRAR